jgi:hypothetical protein
VALDGAIVAVNWVDWPMSMLALVGDTVTPVTGTVLVTVTEPERAGSCTDVAVMVDVPAVPGASKRAVVLVSWVMVPPPETDHVTAVSVALVVVPV